MAIATVNPATGETLKTYDEISDAEVERCLAAAAKAHASYRLTDFGSRAAWMRRAASILDDEAGQIAAMMTTEMGKTLAAARQEVAKCANACRFYADCAEEFLADEPADAEAVGADRAYVTYQSIGAVLAIMPWNFPLWQAMRFAVPSLMAGNVGLLKHASNVPQTALFMQDLFARAGFPEGTFQTLLVGSARIEAILRDEPGGRRHADRIGTGRAVGGRHRRQRDQEGRPGARRQRPVHRDAVGRPGGRGQDRGRGALPQQRPVVHRGEALHRARSGLRRLRAPLRRADGRQDRRGPHAGEHRRWPARLGAAAQGHRGTRRRRRRQGRAGALRRHGPGRPGWYYPPTVLAGITGAMRVHREEVFGPVATIYRVADIDEAIDLANSTEFGLGANAWTDDEEERARFVRDLAAGMVFINGNVTSYPQLPFGGVKTSGHGRELAAAGIREFCNIKSVWMGSSQRS